MHSEGNPSGPFVLGLQGLKLMKIKCASRLMWSAARASCVLRSVPKSKPMAGPAMSGLRRITGWGNMARFSRLGWGLSRRRVWRFAPRVLSIGIEMHVVLLALRLLRPRSRLGSRPFCYGANMNVVLMSRWTVVFFGERRILPTVYLVCQLKRKRALVIV